MHEQPSFFLGRFSLQNIIAAEQRAK